MSAATSPPSAENALTEGERAVLRPVFAGRSTMPSELVPAVERIVRERMAAALIAASWEIVRGAGLIPPPNGQHPAVTWLREQAAELRTPPTGADQ